MNKPPLIAKTNRGSPPRGAFDYLLKDMKDEAPRGWTPLPPPEHGGGGGPRRVRVEIEIIQSQQQPPAKSRGWSVLWWLVLAAILLAMAGCTTYEGPLATAYGVNLHAQQLAAQRDAAAWAAYNEDQKTKEVRDRVEAARADAQAQATAKRIGYVNYSFGLNGRTVYCARWISNGTLFTECD